MSIHVDRVDVTIPGLADFPFPRMIDVEQVFPRPVVAVAHASFAPSRDKVRFVRIPNTKNVHRIQVSESYLPEIRNNPALRILGDSAPMVFDDEVFLHDG